MAIFIGSSNQDGTGSAANLTTDNGQWIDLENGTHYVDDTGDYSTLTYSDELVNIIRSSSRGGEYLNIENISDWNADGVKELSINFSELLATDYNEIYAYLDGIFIYNFVDVSFQIEEGVILSSEQIDLEINAKRATIDTSSAHYELFGNEGDVSFYISISANSNSSSWSNLFDITTGNNDDTVVLYHQSNSQWSEFDVELGGGEDIFYYQINKAATSNQLRDVDGGDGIDSLILYNSDNSYYFDNNDMTVSHFEVIAANTVNHNYTFTLNEELLQDNNDNELGLIVAGLNIEFSDQYDSLSVDTLTDTQEAYLEANLPSSYRQANLDDYYAVTVTYDDQTYTLIATNISSFWTDLP